MSDEFGIVPDAPADDFGIMPDAAAAADFSDVTSGVSSAPAPVAPMQPMPEPDRPHEFVKIKNADGEESTLKAYGLQTPGISSLAFMSGPFMPMVHAAQQAKQMLSPPVQYLKEKFIDPAVSAGQNYLAEGLETKRVPGTMDPTVTGGTSYADRIKEAGASFGKFNADATGQPQEGAAQGGAALAEYFTKSGLSFFIGSAPFEKLDDDTKHRAMRELEQINRHGVVAHQLRKASMPGMAAILDKVNDETADVVGAAQESFIREASMLPFYMIGTKNIVALEGTGEGMALLRNMSMGGQFTGLQSLLTPGSNLVDSVVEGAEAGGAFYVAGRVARAAGKAISGRLAENKAVAAETNDVEGRFKNARDITPKVAQEKGLTVEGENPGLAPEPAPEAAPSALAREPRPEAPREPVVPAPVVMGVSSDAMKELTAAAVAHITAPEAGTGLARRTEVPHTDRNFQPNITVLHWDEVSPGRRGPVLYGVEWQADGSSRVSRFPITGEASYDEALGIRNQWKASVVVSADMIVQQHPLEKAFRKNDIFPHMKLLQGGWIERPSKNLPLGLAEDVASANRDIALSDDPARPGYMMFYPAVPGEEIIGGGTGTNWQLHQLSDPVARKRSLKERKLHGFQAKGAAEDEVRWGFPGPPDEWGFSILQAPAAAEGIENGLVHHREIRHGDKVWEATEDEIARIGDVEPASITSEREIYRHAAEARNVEELVGRVTAWRDNASPQLQADITRYFARETKTIMRPNANMRGWHQAQLRAAPTMEEGSRARIRRQLFNELQVDSQLGENLLMLENQMRNGSKVDSRLRQMVMDDWKSAQQQAAKGGPLEEAKIGTESTALPPDPNALRRVGGPDLSEPIGPMEQSDHARRTAEAGSEAWSREADNKAYDAHVAEKDAREAAEGIMEMPQPRAPKPPAAPLAEGDTGPVPSKRANSPAVMLADGEEGIVKAFDPQSNKVTVVTKSGGMRTVPSEMVVAQAPAPPAEVSAGPAEPPSNPNSLGPPQPPIDGLGGGTPPVPPPQHIPESLVMHNEVYLALARVGHKVNNFIFPPWSRGPQVMTGMALQMSASPGVARSVREDAFNTINKVFGDQGVEFNDALANYVRGPQSAEATQALMDRFPKLNRAMVAFADEMKARINLNESKLKDFGMLGPHTAHLDNDTYFTREYLKHTAEPGLNARMQERDQATVREAIEYAKTHEFEARRASMEPAELEQEARLFIENVMGKWDKAADVGTAGAFGTARTALLERKDIAPIYRKLMGEVTGPAGLASTLGKQEQLLVIGSVMKDLSELAPFAQRMQPSDDAVLGAWRKLDGDIYGLANGMYVHPAIYEQLFAVNELSARVQLLTNGLVAHVKKMRTVFAPSAYVTSTIGNIASHVASDGLDPILRPQHAVMKLAEAAKMLSTAEAKNPLSKSNEMRLMAQSFGLIDSGHANDAVIQGNLERALDKLTRGGQTPSYLSAMRVVSDVALAAGDKMGTVYNYFDQLSRVADWLGHMEKGMENPKKFLGPLYVETLAPERIKQLVARDAATRTASSFMMLGTSRGMTRAASNISMIPLAANNFLASTVDELRIAATYAKRLSVGVGGESRASVWGKALKYSLVLGAMYAGSKKLNEERGITPKMEELSEASMSEVSKTHRKVMFTLPYTKDGNLRSIDFTSAFPLARYTQGNPDADLHKRIIYNLLMAPVSGTMEEDSINDTLRRAGFTAPGASFDQKASPMQTRGWKSLVEAAANSGILPAGMNTILPAMNKAGLYGTPPKDETQSLYPAEALLSGIGLKVIPGGNPATKAKELNAAKYNAQVRDAKKVARMKDGEQPGVKAGGITTTKDEARQHQKEDAAKAKQRKTDFNSIRYGK